MRLEIDLSILSDPSHDKIYICLCKLSALDLWLQFARLKLSDTLPPPFKKNIKNTSQVHKF